jgi:hypothetical protein
MLPYKMYCNRSRRYQRNRQHNPLVSVSWAVKMIPQSEINRTLERPLGQLLTVDIIATAVKAADCNPADIDALLLCWDELERRKRSNKRARTKIRQIMSEIHVGEAQSQEHQHRIGAGPWRCNPIDWYSIVHAAAHCLYADTHRKPGCSHYLYVVLLGGFGAKENEFGLYIGESAHRPQDRLAQHLNGIHASHIVKKRGICLLPSLYSHLNPLQRAEAKELEPKLKEIFIAVRHSKTAYQRRPLRPHLTGIAVAGCTGWKASQNEK